MDKKTVKILISATFVLNFCAAFLVYLFFGLIAAALTILMLCGTTFTTMLVLNKMLKANDKI